jgi:hypothetical protein
MVPALWAGALLVNFNDAHVFKSGFNKDYEGEIEDVGSSLKINSIGRITISNYVANQDLAAPETLNFTGQWLLITEGKTFNFYVDDLDKRQAKGDLMSPAMTEASWGLAEVCDIFLATTLDNAMLTANTLTAGTVGTGAGELNAYDVVVRANVLMDDNNIPGMGRYGFVPNWFAGMLRRDPRFSSFGTPGNVGQAKKGDPITEIDGTILYKSNNLPLSGSDAKLIFGSTRAATFAQQILKTEGYQPPLRFGDAVKGLHVYGAKVTRPNGLVRLIATQGA